MAYRGKIRWYTRRSTKVGVAAWQRDQELLRVLNDFSLRLNQLENWQVETDALLEGK